MYPTVDYEKYDDAILADTDEDLRESLHGIATDLMLPPCDAKIFNLVEMATKFRKVAHHHKLSKTKEWKDYFNCYFQNFFSHFQACDEEERFLKALFYLMVKSDVPLMNEENFTVLQNSLKNISRKNKLQAMKLEGDQVKTAEMVEKGVQSLITERFFENQPHKILHIMPTIHFLRNFEQPQIHSDSTAPSSFWGFYSIPLQKVRDMFIGKNKSLQLKTITDLLAEYNDFDPILKNSILICLQSEEFFSLLHNGMSMKKLSPESVLLCYEEILEDTRGDTDNKGLEEVLKFIQSTTSTGLFQNTNEERTQKLSMMTDRICKKIMKRVKEKETVELALKLLVAVHSTIVENTNFPHLFDLCLTKLDDLWSKQNVKLEVKVEDLSTLAKITDSLYQKVEDQIRRKLKELTDVGNKKSLINAFTDIKEMHIGIQQPLEEVILKMKEQDLETVVSKFQDKVLSKFKKDQSIESRYRSLLLNLSKKSLPGNKDDPQAILAYVMRNPTFKRIISLSAFEDKEIRLICERYLDVIQNAVVGNSTVHQFNELERHGIKALEEMTECVNKFLNIDSKLSTRTIELRFQELNEYQRLKKSILNILSIFNYKPTDLSNEINKFPDNASFNEMILKDLCDPRQSENEAYILHFEEVYIEKLQVIEDFEKWNNTNSTFFRDRIREETKALKPKVSDKSSTGEDQVVQVVFEMLASICDSIKDIGMSFERGSISLPNVKKFCHEIWKTGTDNLFSELQIIEKIVTPGKHWAYDASSRVDCMFQLAFSSEKAELLLRIARFLGVTGDLPEIEKVIMCQNNLEAKLSVINPEDIKLASFFTFWTDEQFESLKAMETCQKFITWIKENLESFQEFKVFVDLASISAGESDIEIDRVQNMQSAVSAYSALIFEVGAKSSFDDLLKAVNQVFLALKEDYSVHSKLIDTNRHLEWLKMINERHASVKTSSVQQVKAINATGVYSIGGGFHPLEDSLRLEFQQVQKQDEEVVEGDYRQHMTNTELKDLQSKLMLITMGTEGAEEAEKFEKTLTWAQRIEKGIKKLCSAGCSLTKKMKVSIFCDLERKTKVEIDFNAGGLLNGSKDLSLELPMLAEFIESCYEEWNNHLSQLRDRYPATRYRYILFVTRLGLIKSQYNECTYRTSTAVHCVYNAINLQ